MNNYLKICFNIYITMSAIDKSIVSVLEGDLESIEYGVPEFNKLIKSLDSKTKNKPTKSSHSDKSDKKSDDKSDKKSDKKSDDKSDKKSDKKDIDNNDSQIQKNSNESSREENKSFEPKIHSESQKDVKIAIIVPFRDQESEKKRTKQLNTLVEYFKSYLKDDEYKIFVVEQSNDQRKFNRGQLLNIGFEYAVKEGYNNFIFHDADLLPSDELKEYYENIPEIGPVHIAAVWDRYGSNQKYFGGIVVFNKKMFERINGYPNDFWGWGGEDD